MRLFIVSLLLFTTSALAADRDLDMKDSVNAFYTIYLSERPSGVPSEQEQQKFNPYLSAPLGKLLKEAARAEQQYYQATKGESPPLVEGDLFTSLFEGATSFKTLSCDSRTGSCIVEFRYVDPKEKAPTIWKDKVYLIKGHQGWVVDDIEFLGTWEFMHKGRLQDLLKQVISEGNEN